MAAPTPVPEAEASGRPRRSRPVRAARRRACAGRRRLGLAAVLSVLVLVLTTSLVAQGAPTFDPDTPPSPDLRRPVLLSLARRVVPGGGVPLPVGGPAPEPYVTGPAAESPEIIPPPPLASGTGALYAVGDSVLLGAEPYLATTLDGWDVRLDAKVSRGVPEGLELVRMNRDRIGDVLVVVLGHNYGGGGKFAGWLDALLAEVDDVQRVVLVTVTEWSGAQPEVNAAIRRAPETYPNVVVADWAAVVAANPQFLRDHVHPSRSGAMALANLIAVMTGPAPGIAGRPPPRPRLLTIPNEPVDRVRTSTTTSAAGPVEPSTTTTSGGPGGTGGSTSTTGGVEPSSTTTTDGATTTTTTASSTTSVTSVTTTATTVAPTSTTAAPTTTSEAPPANG